MYDDVLDPEFATEGSACFDISSYLGPPVYTESPPNLVTVYTMNNKKESREVKMWAGPKSTFYTSASLYPGERMLVPTGLIFDIPAGYSLRLHTRSSVSLKQGLVMANSEGIIDSDYYHQCFIMLYNSSADEIRVKHKERMAQGELIKTLDYSLKETTIQPERTTERVGGFGSTGK
tara:strand:- start:60 stop:587 length:528 start_codon:yes stop_codon:yes gene_type:complete